MNSVKLTGRLTDEPKLAPTDAGRAVCDMRVTADNGRYRSFDIDVSVFDAPARVCVERLSKGDEVRVSGELRFRRWRDRVGRWHEGFSIAGLVEPLAGSPRQDAEPPVRPVGAAVAGPSPARLPADGVDQPGPRPLSGVQLGVVESRHGRYGDPYA
jgi:single-stranded DNA-binding protein